MTAAEQVKRTEQPAPVPPRSTTYGVITRGGGALYVGQDRGRAVWCTCAGWGGMHEPGCGDPRAE